MSTFAEYTNKKKKKKDIANTSFKDYTSSVLGISFADIAPIGKDKEERKAEDIAPVKTEEKERSWFQKGEFEDGYQFGDLTKTILGSGNDLTKNVGAGIIGMGEKAVDALMYLAPSAYQSSMVQAGQSFDIKTYREMQKESADFIQKDLYDEQKVAKTIISDPFKKVTGIDSETASVFGAKSDALAQSAGQLGATIGLQALGLPWWVTTGVSSFGGEAESAFKEGASYEQAGGSALITAGADILTEKISGGIKFGGKTLDDGLTKALARTISDKTLRTLTKLGVDATGEGLEEVLAGAVSNLGTALYKEENIDELLFNEQAMDEYIESFVGGAVLGGGMGGINAVRSNSKGVDYVTEMTENEQKVHDAEVKRRTEEAEKAKENGEKLTGKEKKAIYEEVTEDLERGHIDISNIESVLGGETYENYNSIVEQEKAINEEIEALENKVESTFTHKDSERLAELREQLKTIDKQSVQERLSAEVEEMTRADRLHESYNERSRKGQAFEVDLTQYAEGVQRDTVKSAVESGILNNTNRTHEFVDLVAKLSADKGVLFDFTDNAKLKETGFALEGRTINGYVQNGKIAVNINSSKALNTVVGHEITHVLQGTELYSQLQQAVTQYAKTKGEYDSRLEAITKLYEGVENANVENELTAELVGEYIFTDKDFINNLSTEQPSLFQKILDEVKYLAKVATAGSKEARELAKAKRVFEQAYKETSKAKATDSINYHVSEDFSGEIDKVLNGELSSQNQVKARDYTPQILVDNGVSNLPMLITQNHIKSIIYTEAEAKQLGLPINNKTHYHGLGKDLLIRAIDSMDNPSEIYKKDADHYIFITELTDADGNTIIVPVKVDGKGTYNDVYIDENQIQSVYGKKNLVDYLARNGFDKVDIKKGTALNEGDQFPNISNSFENSVPQNSKKSSSGYRVYGSEVALEAPVKETVAEGVTEVANDYAPLTEEMANERDAQQSDRLYSLDDADAPQEVEEAPYFENEPVEPADPFAERDIQDVGKKNIKAYMYENPEVRPYFQEEAKIMLRELQDSIKGERIVNADLLYETGGEFGVWGTKRETSEQIAYLLDRFKYTYAEIR